MRREQEQVEAVELDAVDLGRGGQVEHRVQIDRRLRALPLADHPRPGRVVQFRIVVGMTAAHDDSLTFLAWSNQGREPPRPLFTFRKPLL